MLKSIHKFWIMTNCRLKCWLLDILKYLLPGAKPDILCTPVWCVAYYKIFTYTASEAVMKNLDFRMYVYLLQSSQHQLATWMCVCVCMHLHCCVFFHSKRRLNSKQSSFLQLLCTGINQLKNLKYANIVYNAKPSNFPFQITVLLQHPQINKKWKISTTKKTQMSQGKYFAIKGCGSQL